MNAKQRAVLDRVYRRADGETAADKLASHLAAQDERMKVLEEQLCRRGHVVSAESSGNKAVSIQKVIRGIVSGDWTGAEFEQSVLVAKERTALATTSDTLGGYVVPPEYLPQEFVEMIYTESSAMGMGIRRLNVQGGHPVVIPTQESGATVYWTAENAAITESNPTFGQKEATPHGLKCLVKTSNRLLRDSNPTVEQLIREDIAKAIGVELDNQILNGDGSSGKPLGILNTTGVNSTTATAAMGLDNLWDMIYEVEKDNAWGRGSEGALLAWQEWHKLRKAADAAGQPKYYAGAGAPIAKEAYGIPVGTDGNLAAGTAIVGCWNQAILVQWGGIEFLASQHAGTAFAADQTWVRACIDVDLVVREPLSFCTDTTFT